MRFSARHLRFITLNHVLWGRTMAGPVRHQRLLFIFGIGNIVLWLVVSLGLIGGCAVGEEPFFVVPLVGYGNPHVHGLEVHPVLWVLSWIHTFTVITVSVPLSVVFVVRTCRREDGEVSEIHARIRRKNLARPRSADSEKGAGLRSSRLRGHLQRADRGFIQFMRIFGMRMWGAQGR
jgi:hypothetical protein